MHEREEARLTLAFLRSIQKNLVSINRSVASEVPFAFWIQYALLPIMAALPYALAWVTGRLIDELTFIAGAGSVPAVVLYLLIALVFLNVGNFLYDFRSYYGQVVWYYLESKYMFDMMQKRANLDLAVQDDPEKRDLIQRATDRGPYSIRWFLDVVPQLLQNLLEIAFALVVFVSSAWWLAIVAAIAAAPRLYVQLLMGRKSWELTVEQAEARRKYWHIQDKFSWTAEIAEMRLFQSAGYLIDYAKRLFDEYVGAQRTLDRNRNALSAGADAFSEVVIGIGLFLLVVSVATGDITVGTFTFLMGSVATLRGSFNGVFRSFGSLYEENLYVNDFHEFMQLSNSVPKPERGVRVTETPTIEFRNVSFTYPGQESPALTHVSLTIPRGTKLALVGVNGSGKTTLVKLLCRFYDPTEGEILVDGVNLKDVDIESWYAILGVLFQEYSSYHFLVRDAIALGRVSKEQKIEAVKAAAQAAEADAFIETWEKKYDQQLSVSFTGGVTPSIGQSQKLALARTFYRDPQVLILDEPTASIDAEAEAKIFERIQSLSSGRTVILISHRFSTVRQADHIAVLKDGMVHEYGTHDELIAKEGTYARLFKLQAKGYQ